jgi:hypothetical protein
MPCWSVSGRRANARPRRSSAARRARTVAWRRALSAGLSTPSPCARDRRGSTRGGVPSTLRRSTSMPRRWAYRVTTGATPRWRQRRHRGRPCLPVDPGSRQGWRSARREEHKPAGQHTRGRGAAPRRTRSLSRRLRGCRAVHGPRQRATSGSGPSSPGPSTRCRLASSRGSRRRAPGPAHVVAPPQTPGPPAPAALRVPTTPPPSARRAGRPRRELATDHHARAVSPRSRPGPPRDAAGRRRGLSSPRRLCGTASRYTAAPGARGYRYGPGRPGLWQDMPGSSSIGSWAPGWCSFPGIAGEQAKKAYRWTPCL